MMDIDKKYFDIERIENGQVILPGGEILDVDNVAYFDLCEIRLYGGKYDGATFTIDEVEIAD